MQPFSRRAFLKALATATAAASLPVDLTTAPIGAGDALPIATSAGPLVALEIAFFRTPIEVTACGDANRVYVPSPEIRIRIRCDATEFHRTLDAFRAGLPRVGDRVALAEDVSGYRISGAMIVDDVERRPATRDAIITATSIGPIRVRREAA